jgi:hypothetical protein
MPSSFHVITEYTIVRFRKLQKKGIRDKWRWAGRGDRIRGGGEEKKNKEQEKKRCRRRK